MNESSPQFIVMSELKSIETELNEMNHARLIVFVV